jgi:hypothetical protein
VANVIDRLPQELLKELVDETDAFAVENVRLGRGGPFGASVHVYNLNGGDVHAIGTLEANAVIEKGMGSAHAEDQAMNPETISTLKELLSELDADAEPVVIFSSSGESCPACHSKEEILCRTLVQEELLTPGHFVVTYGATYEDTANIAGFNDAPYHYDMQLPKGEGMISIDDEDVADIPFEVRQIFEKSDRPVSVVALEGGRYIYAYEDRKHDLMATSEVAAIRAAAAVQKESGLEEPWNLGEATIYTSTSDVGPLGYAECQWANITQWVSVNHPKAQEWATQEAPDVSNDAFFTVIAHAEYNQPEATLSVHRIEPFENKAQYEWKNKNDKVMYNGIEHS